jgi:hypothetical protein
MDAVDNPIPFWATSHRDLGCPRATLPILDFRIPGQSLSQVRPLKLDDKVLISARMRSWYRIKKVCCSSFLKKLRQNTCFHADDLASGHISWSHFGESHLSRYCLTICACISVHVLVSGLCEYRFQTEVHAHLMLVLEREPRSENRSVWKSIHMSTRKNVENLKMKVKVNQIPSLLFKNWLTRTI